MNNNEIVLKIYMKRDEKITPKVVIKSIVSPDIECYIKVTKEIVFPDSTFSRYNVEIKCPNIFLWQCYFYKKEELISEIDRFTSKFERVAAKQLKVELGVLDAAKRIVMQVKEFIEYDTPGVLSLDEPYIENTNITAKINTISGEDIEVSNPEN